MTIFSFNGQNGMRDFDVRLRMGVFELWTRNEKLKEKWHPVKTSFLDNQTDAANELYFWSTTQNWAEYNPHTKDD